MTTNNENAALYFVDRHATGGVSKKAAYIETDGLKRTLTYAQLAKDSAKMGHFFERCGLEQEDRVALLLLDTIEFPIIFWGGLKSGVVPVALNTLLATDVYAKILIDSRAKAIFVSIELLAVVAPALKENPYLEHICVVGSGDISAVDSTVSLSTFKDALEGCQERQSISVCADESAFWLYSSGSTGQPKGVRHVHSSLKHTSDTYGVHVLGIQQEDVVYSAAKFFFAYGLGNALTFPMAVGATTLLLASRPTPEVVLSIINDQKPTIFCGVPTLYAATLAYIEAGKHSLYDGLRRCISAGEALPENVGRTWEALSGCEILDGVGSTELLHIFLSNAPGNVVYGTSGTAVPGYELRLVNEVGEDCATGEVGELIVKGKSAASDYWNQRDKSRSTFEGNWTRTGDKYEATAEGRLIYCGRTDDMFKVSGIWVAPFEVEQALVSHSHVMEAAVVPRRDADGLEKPQAYVVLKSKENSENLVAELQEHVKQTVGKWKYPRWVDIVDDLPKTATGKIQRFKLRQD